MKQRIAWIEVHRKRDGGSTCDRMAREALKKECAVELVVREARLFSQLRYLKIPEALVRLLFLKGERDLWVRDFYSALTMEFDRTRGKNLVVVYHDDFSGFPLFVRPLLVLFQKTLFYWNLRKADGILVIAEFWRQHFLKKGYQRIFLVHVGFDFESFAISDKEVEEFKKREGLTGKPIVYLGNCQKAKGVVEAYEALKELDVHLITSGEREVHIPARNLNLPYQDYLKLLKASSVVVTMSKFKEGWCITAHEAMYLRTPVIGSGRGGMRELLEGGRQIICEDMSLLREHVEFLLAHSKERARQGEMGHAFARQFPKERFERAWLDTAHSILEKQPNPNGR